VKETREEIKNYLKKYHAQEIKLLCGVVIQVLPSNHDFRIATGSDEGDIRKVIERECERKILFSNETIISKDDAELFRMIDELDYKQTKLGKTKQIELMAGVLGSDTLFEGFCLAFHDSDDSLEEFCKLCGCAGRYQECALEPVYRKRRKYGRLIAEYATAAANLYGVIHIVELEELIWEYERSFRDYKGYARETGSYQNTIMFTPEFIGTYTLHNLVGNVVAAVCTTLDGYILHLCFKEDYEWEQQKFIHHFKGVNRELTEDDLGRFFCSCDTSFRVLHDLASEKEVYFPEKKEFLRYVDETYYEENLACKKMRRYIEKNFMSAFSQAAKQEEITTAQCIDDFMYEICVQASDRNDAGIERDVNDFVQFLFESLEAYDVHFDGTEQENELLGYAMNVANSVRLWINHGCTPQEVRRQMQAHPEETVIVPGSSHAAVFLAEGKSEIEKMGFHVDLDASASQIPIFGFAQGADGEMKKGVKKIYPNDPCPCGSGKKYKKCCGK